MLFCCLWFATLGIALLVSVIPSGNLVSSYLQKFWGVNKVSARYAQDAADVVSLIWRLFTFLPKLGIAGWATLMYLLIGIDNLHAEFPSVFPKGGYLFSDAAIPFYAWLALLWIGWTYYGLLAKYGWMDLIRGAMPGVRTASKELGQRSVVLWNAYSPTVKSKSREAFDVVCKQGKAFCLLNVEFVRHCAMRLGLLGMMNGVKHPNISDAASEEEKMLVFMRTCIDKHRDMLRLRWSECRYFAISFWLIVGLSALNIIF